VINQFSTHAPARSAGETLEMQVLLAHVSGHSRTWLLGHPELSLTPEQENALATATSQLEKGVPLPYIIGHWEFFGLDFIVTPDVLIPRPETELLIETAIHWIRTHPKPAYRIIDVGTGSGIIPISLAAHVPNAEFIAIDISPAALAVARQNAHKHGVEERILFIEGDLLPSDLQLPVSDILIANLPYIPTETLQGLDVFGKEPSLALDGGPDGLDLIRQLLADLAAKKAAGSLILLEIENRQGLTVKELAREAFPAADIQIKKDLAGHDRLAVIHLQE
jgi:release factor glutamine methyltransferase